MSVDRLIFDPLLAWPLLLLAAGLALVLLIFALWRGLPGWWLRAITAAVVLTALANPALQHESRTALPDIVIVASDKTSSQQIGDRAGQTEAALATMLERLQARPNTEIKTITLQDAPGDGGSLMMRSLDQALAEVPKNRLAGVILLSDGQIHDADRTPEQPAPLHVLLSGRSSDWDRRLTIINAPTFAILGEPVTLTLRVEDQGAVPVEQTGLVQILVSIDGGPQQRLTVPVGRDIELPVMLPHGGLNVIQFTVPTVAGELTDRNNSAVVQINGVRDRLRVLLVSGEPHPGERTWRNLLKSDSSVDLVHFTILRPPEKQDGVPVSELSLIAFPTRELFLDKIDEFDLIIFDRYKRRGILPSQYLDNVRDYVRKGGAVLVAAGPDFASADSLYHSSLAEILPAAPTARVFEQGYRPAVTDIGARHPVTEGLENFTPQSGAEKVEWGRWFRQIDLKQTSGNTVMSGIDGRPLLVLDRVGEGRVALLASDQAWLWSRGFEGGGPQLELLRRLAHWMMKEPELEEEALLAKAQGQTVTITRRTLEESAADVEITAPDGTISRLALTKVAPGRYEADFTGPEIGLYRLSDGTQQAVVALGPSAPREFEQTIATDKVLLPAVQATRGGIMAMEAGLPILRNVRPGRPAAGRGWIGLVPRNAYLTAEVTVRPLVSAWLFLLMASLLVVGAWLFEGRR